MPYRDTIPLPPTVITMRQLRPATFEEVIIYAMLIFFGGIPVLGPLIDATPFDAAPTIGLVLMLLGSLGFTVMAIRTWRRTPPRR